MEDRIRNPHLVLDANNDSNQELDAMESFEEEDNYLSDGDDDFFTQRNQPAQWRQQRRRRRRDRTKGTTELYISTDNVQEPPTRQLSKKGSQKVSLVDLELTNVTYTPIAADSSSRVTTKNGTKERARKIVLSRISTKIEPYKVAAWMGPSGSGKSSLISIAAGLTQADDLAEGSVIRINGEQGTIPKRSVGVVWQDDLLLSNLTVEETIFFTARLKTPSSVQDSEVYKLVDETIVELGLSHVRDSLIGNSMGGGIRGVSGGERKRVAVATELVVRPSILLLDEPTSGLDSTSAQALIETLKDLAKLGHAIAVVIHQPRSTIFSLFDNLLLLSRGRIVYNGKARHARSFLEQVPSVPNLPPETDIADWIMDSICEDECRFDERKMPQSWANYQASTKQTEYVPPSADVDQNRDIVTVHQAQSIECSIKKTISSLSSTSVVQVKRRRSTLKELNASPKFETTFWIQLQLLLRRTLKQQRGENLSVVAGILMIGYVIFAAVFWWRLPDDTSHVFQRAVLFEVMMGTQCNDAVLRSVSTFHSERALLHRERSKKLYHVAPYYIAKTLVDATNDLLMPWAFGAIVYWIGNLRVGVIPYFQFLVCYPLLVSFAQSVGLFCSIASSSLAVALVTAHTLTTFWIILAGFYIPLESMNAAFRWLSYFSYARYGYSALLINEFQGRDIPCADGSVPISIGGGECPLPGDNVIASLGMSGITANFWFNVGMLFLLQAFFRITAYLLLLRQK